MTPSQVDDLAAGLHAILCGGPPERWQQAMPATQERYRAMVRYVLDNAPPSEALAQAELSRDTWQKTCEATELQLAAARKERDEQKARADRADACIEELMRQKTELMKLYLAGKTHIAALENVAEAARLLYGVAQTDDIGRQYVAVSWSTWEALRAALDAAQPKDGWLARSVSSVEADPPQARITAEDGPMHIPPPAPRWRTGTKNPHTLYRDDKPAGLLIDPAHAAELVTAVNGIDMGRLRAEYDRGRQAGRHDVGKYANAIGRIDCALGRVGAKPLDETVRAVEELAAKLRIVASVAARGPRFTDRHMEAAAEQVLDELRAALRGEGL